MPRGGIDDQPVRYLPAFLDDGLQVGAVGIGGEHSAGPRVQKINAAGVGLFLIVVWRFRRFCDYFIHRVRSPLRLMETGQAGVGVPPIAPGDTF